MKLELCNFSGYKIYPGHGKRYCRVDGKAFTFINGKCERSFLMKRNPREITWTVLYRRKNKKGTQEETHKRRTRRTTRFQRAIQGATLQVIQAKRNQTQEVRKAQRDQAIRAAKEKAAAIKSAKAAQKKAHPLKGAAGSKATPQAQKATKKVKTQAPRVGGKR
ncbi:large ribosomal subunit protein eL24-like [Corticium candelabrum]|uniref:large ribosomal subunit protein eL24-like n=1 Tax=Corticium candelabrum TaxID=121492 RepID=UPI002E26D9A8|nr:large ribosomal subunit protein eL24-like [Corticium candelabrum]